MALNSFVGHSQWLTNAHVGDVMVQSDAILYVDSSGYKSLPGGESLRLVSSDHNVLNVDSIDAALKLVETNDKIKLLISNSPSHELFSQLRASYPGITSVLVTDLPMSEYSQSLKNEEEKLLDHVIANKGSDSWVILELRTMIRKRFSHDIFGVDKYLAPNTVVYQEVVKSSAQRDLLNSKVQTFAEACHLGQSTSRMAYGITEELLMNTLYDAPAAAGIERFKSIEQTTTIELDENEQGLLSYGCDGQILAISSRDPFGALQQDKVFKYLKKVLKRNDSEELIDTKKGGAGLGLFKILFSSHSLVCNVEKGKCTEIMAVIDLNEPLRDFSIMPRSIHYFSKD